MNDFGTGLIIGIFIGGFIGVALMALLAMAKDTEPPKREPEQKMQKPLDIGDTVHFVLRELDEIDLKEYRFTVGNCAVSDTVQFVTEIGTYGFWVGDSPREFAPDYDDFYHWYELGETVFLSREAAEQALKGLKNND